MWQLSIHITYCSTCISLFSGTNLENRFNMEFSFFLDIKFWNDIAHVNIKCT